MTVHICHPGPQEAGAGRLRFWGQFGVENLSQKEGEKKGGMEGGKIGLKTIKIGMRNKSTKSWCNKRESRTRLHHRAWEGFRASSRFGVSAVEVDALQVVITRTASHKPKEEGKWSWVTPTGIVGGWVVYGPNGCVRGYDLGATYSGLKTLP